MSKFKPPSRHNAPGRLDVADNSFLDLVSTPGPGSDSGEEESSGGLGLRIERGSEGANLSGTLPRTGGMPQSTSEEDNPPAAEDDSANVSPLSTQETSGVDVPGGNPKTQTERVIEDILATRRALLEGREPLNPRGKGSDDLGGDPYACDKETERYLGDRSDKVPNMDLKTMAAEELNDERDETMMPSTDTIAGPTATAFTLAMEGP